jgi:hypothetical protein
MIEVAFETRRDGFDLVSDVVRLVNELASARHLYEVAVTGHKLAEDETAKLRAELSRKSAEWESTREAGKSQNKRLSDECDKLRAELAKAREEYRKILEATKGIDLAEIRVLREENEKLREERDELQRKLSAMTEERKFLRLIVDGMQRPPCHCAAGPWIEVVPKSTSNRRVLVLLGDGGRSLYTANGIGFGDVTHYAELRALPATKADPLPPQDHPDYGPWIPGIPAVMDDREVRVRWSGGETAVFNANGESFEDITHYAERKREG